MDGRMRNAQIEMKKQELIEVCKDFYQATRTTMTSREVNAYLEKIRYKTEELMRLQREIP
jgi:hypothetical protein